MTLFRPSGANRLTLPLLMLVAASAMPQVTTISPFLEEIAGDLGTTVGLVGQFGTAQAVGGLVAGLSMAPFVSRVSLRPLLAWAAVVISVTSFLTGLILSYPAMFVFRIMSGAAVGVIVSGALAAVGRAWQAPEVRATRSGFVIGAVAAAPGLLTPLFRLIAAFSNWQMAVVGFGILPGLTALLIFVALPELPGEADSGRISLPERLGEAGRAVLLPIVRHALVLRFLTWGVVYVTVVFLAANLGAEYPGQSAWIGPLYAAGSAGFATGAVASGFIIVRIGGPARGTPFVGLLFPLLMAVYAWLTPFPLVTTVVFGVFMFIVGLYTALIVSYLQSYGGERQSSIMFAYGAITGASNILATLIGGLLIDASGFSGFQVFLTLGAALSLAPLTLLLLSVRRDTRVSTLGVTARP